MRTHHLIVVAQKGQPESSKLCVEMFDDPIVVVEYQEGKLVTRTLENAVGIVRCGVPPPTDDIHSN